MAGFLVAAIVIPSVYMAIGLFVVELSNHWGLITLINNFLPSIVVLALAIMLGDAVRTRRALAAETAQRLRVAHEEREAEAARRVAEERLRIARDVHDTVAHSMATITVQAGSALHVLGDRDEKLRAALTAIRETSKHALREMRATLGQLRQGTPDGGIPVTPGGLDRLPALRDAVTAAGAPVTIAVEGEQRPLPPAIDEVAYRILQESLTNVLRHAGPAARATVRLSFEPAALGITVVDDGIGSNGDHQGQGPVTEERGVEPPGGSRGVAPPGGQGHGLTGMAERAAAVGGKVTAGPRGEGGFEVSASSPSPGRRMIRVLLADDQALVRAGFRMLLEASEDICVVGEAANGGAAVAMAAELRPDVVLMDLRMPEVDGVTATKRISADARLSGVKVVVLTTFDDDEHVFGALRAGASGFLVKDVEPEELLQAVRVVARGDALLAPSVTRSLIAAFTARRPGQRRAVRRARAAGRAPAGGAGCSPGPGHSHRPGAGSGGPGRRGAVERRDRGQARGEPADRQDPCEPGDDQARRPGPGATRGVRLHLRPRGPLGLISSAARRWFDDARISV